MRAFSRQYAEGSRQKRGPIAHMANSPAPSISLPTANCLLPTRLGFTLIEMLIVMGIMVLAITLAIPAIRFLTGSRSEQAAQNTAAAFLARARAEAVGLQRPEGVLFYIDLATDRVNLCQVWRSVPQPAIDIPGVTYLDAVPNHDNLVLPPGIRAWTMKDQAPSGSVEPFPGGYRYLGYNQYPGATATDRILLGGVILFDAHGQITPVQYGFRFQDAAASSVLGQLAYATPAGTANWPASGSSNYIRSQVGFAMFDLDTFHTMQGTSATPDGNTAGQEGTIDPWLDLNTTPLLVNRYNGTLIRGE